MQIFVEKPQGNTTTLYVESNETIFALKRKLKEKEGILSDLDLVLIYNGYLLDDEHTLAHYDILKESTLRLFWSQDALADEPRYVSVETWSHNIFYLVVKHEEDTIDVVKAKIQEQKGFPLHKQLLFYLGKWLEDGSRTLAHYHIPNFGRLKLAIQLEQAPPQTKIALPATPTNVTSIFDTCDGEATAALVPESQACPPSSVLATAHNKEKELEATISRLKAGKKKIKKERKKAENKKNEQELTIALNKEKELEATISVLKDENKKNEEIAQNKEKELEATICALMYKNKLFSDQCASYENLVDDLEVENQKTKEELMNADKKYYAGARAVGYAEGLKEGKAKGLKSVEFLHHLTDASMRFFNHGFDSCQKQAEEQGFCGQLNKSCALKDAPDLKG